MRRIISATTSVALAAAFWTNSAVCEPVADFYKGKKISFIIGYPAGSGYDVHARLLSHHLGRHIPGQPLIVPQNMGGAGSVIAANFLYDVAPRDGTAIGAINRTLAVSPLLGSTDAQKTTFDPLKFGWIGSMNSSVTIGMVWAESGITKFEDLLTREVVVSSSGTSSDSHLFGLLLNNLTGTKLKIISGYSGSQSHYLAMERGEVTGYMGTSYSSLLAAKPDWIRDKKVNILVQISLAKDPALPNIPLISSFAKGENDKKALELILAPQQMSRPYIAPPNVDPARLQALQTAFMATMKDTEFLAEAKKTRIDVDPMDGPAMKALIDKLYKSSPEVVAAAKEAIRTN